MKKAGWTLLLLLFVQIGNPISGGSSAEACAPSPSILYSGIRHISESSFFSADEARLGLLPLGELLPLWQEDECEDEDEDGECDNEDERDN